MPKNRGSPPAGSPVHPRTLPEFNASATSTPVSISQIRAAYPGMSAATATRIAARCKDRRKYGKEMNVNPSEFAVYARLDGWEMGAAATEPVETRPQATPPAAATVYVCPICRTYATRAGRCPNGCARGAGQHKLPVQLVETKPAG